MISFLRCIYFFFFFKQKTAYEMRISDWSSDVCSSDLVARLIQQGLALVDQHAGGGDLLAAFAVHASALTSPLSIWKPARASSSQRARCRSSRVPLVAM